MSPDYDLEDDDDGREFTCHDCEIGYWDKKLGTVCIECQEIFCNECIKVHICDD